VELEAIRAAIASKTYTPAHLEALLGMVDGLRADLARAEQVSSRAIGALEVLREAAGEGGKSA
jgi:hypothetical protein